MTHHLGYEAGDPAGRGSGNSHNGSSPKTVTTVNGPVDIVVPRDRNGSFEPVILPKRARRLNNINSVVLSLYSRGMTTRDIEAHLEEVYGAKSRVKLISNITEVVPGPWHGDPGVARTYRAASAWYEAWTAEREA